MSATTTRARRGVRLRVLMKQEQALKAARLWLDADAEDDAAYARLRTALLEAMGEWLRSRGWEPPEDQDWSTR